MSLKGSTAMGLKGSAEQRLRAWLFDGNLVAPTENGGETVQWMRHCPEEVINALREEAEKALAQKREEHQSISAQNHRDKQGYGVLISDLRESSDEELYAIAYALRDLLRSETKVPSLNVFSGYLGNKIACFNANHKVVREERKEQAERQKREAERLKREAAREAQREAEYAFLLAQGRKSRTLQQAYANGDFIPLDNSEKPTLRSSTGHRLGSRGK